MQALTFRRVRKVEVYRAAKSLRPHSGTAEDLELLFMVDR